MLLKSCKNRFFIYFAIFCIFLSFSCFSVYAEDDFSRGEGLFRQNEAYEAIPFLKKAVSEGSHPKAYVYLSVAYYQLGRYQESLDICNLGMKVSGTDKKVLSFNAGNTAFSMGDWASAEAWYSKAIMADSEYAPPYLNRANSRMKQNKIELAKEDYERYARLEPESTVAENLEILISLIDDEIASQKAAKEAMALEEKRLKEEEERLMKELAEREKAAQEEAERLRMEQAERERIAKEEAERKALEEAEKRRRLLEDVAASLQGTQTQNMSAGAEGTVDYDYESELE